MSNLAKKPLRRDTPRLEAVHAEIHGIATREQGRSQGPFLVWDLSDSGLRIWLSEHVTAGEIIRLTIAKPFVVLLSVEVRWCKATADGTGFHVGVRALSNLGRLEALSRSLARVNEEAEADAEAQAEADSAAHP